MKIDITSSSSSFRPPSTHTRAINLLSGIAWGYVLERWLISLPLLLLVPLALGSGGAYFCRCCLRR